MGIMPSTKSHAYKPLFLVVAFATVPAILLAAPVPEPDAFAVSVSSVYAFAVEPDGRIPIGGPFTSVAGETRNGLARLLPEGALDPDFNPLSARQVLAVTVQKDGAILAGGSTGTTISEKPFMSRILPSGTVDSSFNAQLASPAPSSRVRSIAVASDGGILVAGAFTSASGVTVGNIARLNASGAIDETFKATASSSIYALVLQSDGKILIGGQFRQVNGVARNLLARLNPDGTLDEAFTPSVIGTLDYVYTILSQPDGKILIGGNFSAVSGESRNLVARLNSDGSLDGSFVPAAISGASAIVYSMALQCDGKIILGGRFALVGGENHQNLVRLNSDGSLDSSFTTEALGSSASGSVSALAIQPAGKILVGGSYTNLGAQARSGIGRLEAAGPVAEEWMLAGDELTWTRSGAAPEIWRATFDCSTNGVSWSPLGDGVRTAAGWKINGVASIPRSAKVRATGWTTGGRYNGSGWWFESTATLADLVRLQIHTTDSDFGISGGHFAFNYSGPAGMEVVVEASGDGSQWVPVSTNTLSDAASLFTDPDPVQPQARLYRLRQR